MKLYQSLLMLQSGFIPLKAEDMAIPHL